GILRRTAQRFPDRDAVAFCHFAPDGRTVLDAPTRDCFRRTWSAFDADVDRAARALIGMGIRPGEHVAAWGTNRLEWLLLQFGCARIGAVLVNVNPAYRASEMAYVLEQSDSVALFLIDRFRKSDYFAMLGEVLPEPSTKRLDAGRISGDGGESRDSAAGLGPAEAGHYERFPKLRRLVSMASAVRPGMLAWDEFLALGDAVSADELTAREMATRPDDPVNMQYTSGTTGFPKGALLAHRSLLLNAFHVGACQLITKRDRMCVPLPFYHCFGCVLGTLCATVYGAALVVPAEHFDPGRTLAAIETERATVLYGVPTMFIAQLEHPDFPHRDLSSLRTGIMSGSPCPIEVMKKVLERMGIREITIAYGQTEASPVITQTGCRDALELRVRTVGKPLPGVEVKIVDPATGAELPDEQPGELCTRGHVVMLGYYKNPEATAQAIDADGWLHTGDLALRLPNGYYRITGRIKDMICRGGENIYPREIEECLYGHPAVEDVAVVGVPDPKFIEEIAAWVRLKTGACATEEELRDHCRQRLAHFKTPRYLKLVTEFPQTVSGKIQKFRIREAMIAELGLERSETA
ncbi:MAG: AMP-binding protein, partial [Planctomycetaceae bacterium]